MDFNKTVYSGSLKIIFPVFLVVLTVCFMVSNASGVYVCTLKRYKPSEINDLHNHISLPEFVEKYKMVCFDRNIERKINSCNLENKSKKKKCWDMHPYILASIAGLKKFCKCVEGSYDYDTYIYSGGEKYSQFYLDDKKNNNWKTGLKVSYYSSNKVKCSGGGWYDVNRDYYYIP